MSAGSEKLGRRSRSAYAQLRDDNCDVVSGSATLRSLDEGLVGCAWRLIIESRGACGKW